MCWVEGLGDQVLARSAQGGVKGFKLEGLGLSV